MSTVNEKAFAKLNLALDVLSARTDGYHDLSMVMISVSLYDDVAVTLRTDGRITVKCNFPWIPTDDRNLAVKAVKAFRPALGDESLGADIRLTKRVPVGAGMAGGSTDAAAVLRALNRLTDHPFSADRLRELGLSVGSDVPYCIQGGAMLAEGRGERLTPLRELPEWDIVVCKPGFSVSTGELFRRVDGRRENTHPDTAGMLEAIGRGDLSGVARRMFNVFEDVLPRTGREISAIRSALLELGAQGAVMTGTGSAVFGLFPDKSSAARAHGALKKQYRECFCAHPVPRIDI